MLSLKKTACTLRSGQPHLLHRSTLTPTSIDPLHPSLSSRRHATSRSGSRAPPPGPSLLATGRTSGCHPRVPSARSLEDSCTPPQSPYCSPPGGPPRASPEHPLHAAGKTSVRCRSPHCSLREDPCAPPPSPTSPDPAPSPRPASSAASIRASPPLPPSRHRAAAPSERIPMRSCFRAAGRRASPSHADARRPALFIPLRRASPRLPGSSGLLRRSRPPPASLRRRAPAAPFPGLPRVRRRPGSPCSSRATQVGINHSPPSVNFHDPRDSTPHASAADSSRLKIMFRNPPCPPLFHLRNHLFSIFWQLSAGRPPVPDGLSPSVYVCIF